MDSFGLAYGISNTNSEIEKKRDMYTNQKDIEQGNVGHPLLSSGEC